MTFEGRQVTYGTYLTEDLAADVQALGRRTHSPRWLGERWGGSGRKGLEIAWKASGTDHAVGADAKRLSPSASERSLVTSCPRTLYPALSRGGEYVPRPSFPGETVTMPPPTPLFPGSLTS